MNAADGALPVVFALGLAAVTLPVARAAPLAISAEMQRCAAITAPDERLACYDALKCAAITASDERLACYDALAKDKPVRLPPAPAATNFKGAAREAGFGLAEHVAAKPQGPALIQATVAQVSADRSGKVSVALDNGQTWTFKDEDTRLKSGDRVTIRRAAFGSFLMTTPARHTHRVQRTQ